MRLPNCMLRAEYFMSSVNEFSSIHIFCDEDLSEKIASDFEDIFMERYGEGVGELMEDDDADVDEDDIDEILEALISEAEPLHSVEETEYGVAIYTGGLYVMDVWNHGDNQVGLLDEVLEDTLNDIADRYPSCTIKGYVGYAWSDKHSGEEEQWEIDLTSDDYEYEDEDTIVAESVAEHLSELLEDEEYCEALGENLDLDELKDDLEDVAEYLSEDAWDNLLDVVENCDEDEDDIRKVVKKLNRMR